MVILGPIITGVRTLFRALSVAITQAVYPLIPRLYNLFLYFADFEFLKNDFVYQVWKNIYVLVGVIVLFAIAIKLISSIVNPDTLTDNKKGAKAVYLRAVIAMILIFVAPILFLIASDVQSDLIKDDSILFKLFGTNVGSSDFGQKLAWETFSSFCTPVDSTTGIPAFKIETPVGADIGPLAEYEAVEEDIDNIMDLDFELFWTKTIIENVATYSTNTFIKGAANIAKSTKIGFEYHSVLCPLAGVLVAYEMLLLCMDTVFRTLKLTFLQLMFPLIIGAFVFNPDILKKWAKEYIATFLSVFLKILALSFAVLAIEAMKGGSI